jgi:hypothetical protein
MDDDELAELEKAAWAEFQADLDAYIAKYGEGIAEAIKSIRARRALGVFERKPTIRPLLRYAKP